MRRTFIDKLVSLRENNNKIMLLTGDLGFGFLDTFEKQFPESFFNAGIAEQNMVSVATGLSHQGFYPFIYTINNFASFRCLEQIRNDICYHNTQSVIVSVGPGYVYGSHGYTHYGIEDISVIRCLPNITILSPSDPAELDFIMNNLSNINGPAYLRLGRSSTNVTDDNISHLSFNAPRVIQTGSDVAFFVTGEILLDVVNLIRDIQEKLDFSPTVLSFFNLKQENLSIPLKILENHKYILSVEEHVYSGGFSSMILENFHDEFRKSNVEFIPFTANTKSLGEIGDRSYMISNILKNISDFLLNIQK